MKNMKVNLLKLVLGVMLALLIMSSCGGSKSGQNVQSLSVDSNNLKEVVEVLASDSLQGRLAGSGYDLKSAKYIESKLLAYGYEPLWGESGIVEFELKSPRVAKAYKVYGDSISNMTYNVVMIKRAVDGNGETVVVGAHHDHLGVAKVTNEKRNTKVGDIFYGANDNATGVSTSLEMARLQALIPTKRDLIYVAFGAEELGLLGAKDIVAKFNEKGVKVDFMVNLEMTGTLKGDSVEVLGKDGFDMDKVFGSISNADSLIFIKENSKRHGSDHIPFFDNGTPVICFATMGAKYYHVPQDDLSSINWEGLTKVSNFTNNFLTYIMTVEELPKNK